MGNIIRRICDDRYQRQADYENFDLLIRPSTPTEPRGGAFYNANARFLEEQANRSTWAVPRPVTASRDLEEVIFERREPRREQRARHPASSSAPAPAPSSVDNWARTAQFHNEERRRLADLRRDCRRWADNDFRPVPPPRRNRVVNFPPDIEMSLDQIELFNIAQARLAMARFSDADIERERQDRQARVEEAMEATEAVTFEDGIPTNNNNNN